MTVEGIFLEYKHRTLLIEDGLPNIGRIKSEVIFHKGNIEVLFAFFARCIFGKNFIISSPWVDSCF